MEKVNSKLIPNENPITYNIGIVLKSELHTIFNKDLKVEIYNGAEARKNVDCDCFVCLSKKNSKFNKHLKTEMHNDVHPKQYGDSDCEVSLTEKYVDFHQILKKEIKNDIELFGEKIKNETEFCRNQKIKTKSNFMTCAECIPTNISKGKTKEKMPCGQEKCLSVLCKSLENSPNDQHIEGVNLSNLDSRQSSVAVSSIHNIGERLRQLNSSNAACVDILDYTSPPESCDEIRSSKRKICYKDFSKSDKSALNKRQSPAEKGYNCDMGSFIPRRVKQTRTLTGEKLHKSAFGSNWGQNKESHNANRSLKYKINYTVLKSKSNLIKHKKSHTEEKPYKCIICSAAFTTSSTLVRHKRLHAGEKPHNHKCDTCLAAFTQKSHLTRHKIKHNSYQCDICCTIFPSISALRKHKYKHNSYQCDICSAALISSFTLKRHSKRHKEEKVYQCDICSTVLASISALKRHKKGHRGDKPFKCDTCSAGFTTRSTLARHIRRHDKYFSTFATSSTST